MEQITDPESFIMTLGMMVLLIVIVYMIADNRAVLFSVLQAVWGRYIVSSVFHGTADHSVKPQDQTEQTDQADRQTDPVSLHPLACDQLELDRTRLALIRVLVYNGWTVGQVRSVLKGDNNTIGAEVQAARDLLQVPPPLRVIRVKEDDEQYELAVNE